MLSNGEPVRLLELLYNSITWQSKQQPNQATSLTEAKIFAASEGLKSAIDC